MKHTYIVKGRKSSALIEMTEAAIRTLISYGEVEFERTGHVGKDTFMTHYFKFKD